MKHVTVRGALVLWLVSATAIAQTSTIAERRFALPDHGSFVVRVPRDWNDRVRQPPNRLPPTIAFGSDSGQPFEVLFTPIWPAATGGPLPSRDQLRAIVERAADSVKAHAVESELAIVEFQGRSGSGFYFSATDRAPKPGEFKLMTQGMLRVGALLVTFTILTNDGQELIVKEALEALKDATHDGA